MTRGATIAAAPLAALTLAGRSGASGVPVAVRLLPVEDHTAILRRFARFYRAYDPVYGELVRLLRAAPRRQGG